MNLLNRKRLYALGIDLLLIIMLTNIAALIYANNPSYQAAQRVLFDSTTSFLALFSESSDVFNVYKMLIGENIIQYVIMVFYFILMPFLNNGQTMGKKVMRIKIVALKGNLTIDKLLRRVLIAPQFNALSDLLFIVLIFILKPVAYFSIIVVLQALSTIVNAIGIGMIYFSKENRGIHEFLSATKVIELEKPTLDIKV